MKNIYASLIGASIGAVVVGGVWGSVGLMTNHGAIAKVGGTAITRADFLKQMENQGGQQTLTQLVSNQLIEQGAKKYNVTSSTSDEQTALNNLKQQNGITSDAQLQSLLDANHMTMAQLQQNIRISVLEEKLAERNVTVSDQEIQAYYNQNKSQLGTNGQTPQLSAVKSQIVSAIKQQKAQAPAQLLSDLAKQYPITIMDSTYQGVKTNIENPAPAATGQ